MTAKSTSSTFYLTAFFFNQIVPNCYHFEAEEKLQDTSRYLFDLQKLVK